jgi:hypothetical protein
MMCSDPLYELAGPQNCTVLCEEPQYVLNFCTVSAMFLRKSFPNITDTMNVIAYQQNHTFNYSACRMLGFKALVSVLESSDLNHPSSTLFLSHSYTIISISVLFPFCKSTIISLSSKCCLLGDLGEWAIAAHGMYESHQA